MVRVRAGQVIEQVEQLKAGDAKASWRALKNLIQGHGVKSSLNTVLDREGKEVRGQEGREAVKEAYRGLGVEDMDDVKFDQEFARMCRSHGDGAHSARGVGWQV